MAQADITKSIQTLQNMINIVLVKTGNSIRSYRKESSTSRINAYTGHSFNLPNAVENFHMALDDLETEILLCKATLLRDLDNIRSKHKAPENTSVQINEENINFPEVDGALTTEKSGFKNVKAEIEAAVFIKVQENSENLNLKISDPGQAVLGNLSHQITYSNSKPSIVGTQTFQNANIHDQKKTQDEVLEASAGTIVNPDTTRKPSLDSLFEESIIENSIRNPTGNLINLDASFPNTTEQMPNYSQIQNPNFKVFGSGQNSQDYNAMLFQNLGNLAITTGRFQDPNFPVDQNIGNGKNMVQFNPTGTRDAFDQGFYTQGPQNN